MRQQNIIIALIVLAVIGVGAFMLMGNTTSQNEQPAQKSGSATDKTTESMVEPNDNMNEPKNIVEIASSNSDFSTLVTALTAAGLVETLSGDGPFTVFAPTNAAFAKLPEETLQAVLADKEQLTAILTYHVVPGKVMAKDVVNLKSAKTVQGSNLSIEVNGSTVMVDNAKVITPDIDAKNGVIHVIDTVLIPQ